jgi:hypothetical protein
MAFGRLRLGFFASPAAIWERSFEKMAFSPCGKSTYGNNLRPDERECSLSHHSPPAQEAALCARNAMVLDEWARVLPVAETDSIPVRTASEIEYDAKNDKALEVG